MAKREFPRWLRWLEPQYDEAALFLMSASFILLFATSAALRSRAHDFVMDDWWDPTGWIAGIMFVAGAAYSLYHVFSRRRKGDIEKTVMLLFAVIVNMLSGLTAAIHLFEHNTGWLLVFPIWNVLSAVALFVMYRFGFLDETAVSDEDAHPREALVGGAVVLVVWAVSRFAFDHHWAVTFSLCVAYATTLNTVVVKRLASDDFLAGS